MPLFERQYNARGITADRKAVTIPPSYMLQKFGPVLDAIVSPAKQRLDVLGEDRPAISAPISGLAIIDTGASGTSVDASVCEKLGIKPTARRKIAHAGGSDIRSCYPIQISFPGSPLPAIIVPRAMSADLQFGKTPYILLLGRDLLIRLRFVYNGPAGRIEIAF